MRVIYSSRVKFHLFFVRHNGRWFHDCSSWDKKEILSVFHNDPANLKNKRIVTIENDETTSIKKAKAHVNTYNTKTFVDLTS